MCDCENCVSVEQVERIVQEAVAPLREQLSEEREARKRAEAKADAAIAHIREQKPLKEYRKQNELDKAKIRKSVTEVGEEIEEATADPSDPAEGEPDEPPLFSVIRTPDDQLYPTRRRTKALWKDLKDYTERTPAGRVITNPQLTRVLRAIEPDEGAQIGSELARRVLEESKALTRGAVKVEKSDNRWRMVIPPDWEEQARDAYYDHEEQDQAQEGKDHLTSHSVVRD